MLTSMRIYLLVIRVIETKAGVARYDGKMLANVPKIRDLPPEVSKSGVLQCSLVRTGTARRTREVHSADYINRHSCRKWGVIMWTAADPPCSFDLPVHPPDLAGCHTIFGRLWCAAQTSSCGCLGSFPVDGSQLMQSLRRVFSLGVLTGPYSRDLFSRHSVVPVW